jgi:hypothetical protein
VRARPETPLVDAFRFPLFATDLVATEFQGVCEVAKLEAPEWIIGDSVSISISTPRGFFDLGPMHALVRDRHGDLSVWVVFVMPLEAKRQP